MLKNTLLGSWLQIFWSAGQSKEALASRYACWSSSTRARSTSDPPSKTIFAAIHDSSRVVRPVLSEGGLGLWPVFLRDRVEAVGEMNDAFAVGPPIDGDLA